MTLIKAKKKDETTARFIKGSADFDLEIKDGVEPGTYPVKITMVYKDEDSNVYESSSNVEINVVSVSEAKVVESTPAWMYIVFIIFLLIVVSLVVSAWPGSICG